MSSALLPHTCMDARIVETSPSGRWSVAAVCNPPGAVMPGVAAAAAVSCRTSAMIDSTWPSPSTTMGASSGGEPGLHINMNIASRLCDGLHEARTLGGAREAPLRNQAVRFGGIIRVGGILAFARLQLRKLVVAISSGS